MYLYGAEMWTLQKVDQKYLKSLEMWCWRRMENISWNDYVRNEEVLHRIKDERHIIYKKRRRRVKGNRIGHILHRNCLLEDIIEGKVEGCIEVMGRQGRSSYWMAVRRGEDTVNYKRKHFITLCGELSLEEAMDLL